MFSSGSCPYCVRAEKYLASRGASRISKTMVDIDPLARERMAELTGGRRTVPQIFIAGVHIGGCDDLIELGSSDPAALAELLARAASGS